MLKTRIRIDHGGDLNVRESVDEVAEMIEKAGPNKVLRFSDADGDPLYVVSDHICYFSEWFEIW
ncbi:hypothetical protein [Lactobacillus delbrueckii]|uniref:hypothetical protein n=1 Tax=Lactobacillus delbrueckii TaxID=1584 RepID=UPI0022EBAE39|nr:hypothetical protein [Lactobacillus delbrueckii]MDA3784983.1 hypothetical protein [Lactobacillus delbrueckii]